MEFSKTHLVFFTPAELQALSVTLVDDSAASRTGACVV